MYVPVWKRSVSTSWIEKLPAVIPAERFMHTASGKPSTSSSKLTVPNSPFSSRSARLPSTLCCQFTSTAAFELACVRL